MYELSKFTIPHSFKHLTAKLCSRKWMQEHCRIESKEFLVKQLPPDHLVVNIVICDVCIGSQSKSSKDGIAVWVVRTGAGKCNLKCVLVHDKQK